MTYKEPPMKFNIGTEKFEVDLPLKNKKTKSSDVKISKEAIILLLAIIGAIILSFIFFKFFN